MADLIPSIYSEILRGAQGQINIDSLFDYDDYDYEDENAIEPAPEKKEIFMEHVGKTIYAYEADIYTIAKAQQDIPDKFLAKFIDGSLYKAGYKIAAYFALAKKVYMNMRFNEQHYGEADEIELISTHGDFIQQLFGGKVISVGVCDDTVFLTCAFKKEIVSNLKNLEKEIQDE